MKMLDHPDTIRCILERDGWVIEKEQGDEIHVIHPRVGDEAAARLRLYRLGLLTTSSLRMEFPIPRSGQARE
jgi:hypothetical protein